MQKHAQTCIRWLKYTTNKRCQKNFTRIQKLLSGEAKLFFSNLEVDGSALVLAVLSDGGDEVPDDVIVNPPSVTIKFVTRRRSHRCDRGMVAGVVSFSKLN